MCMYLLLVMVAGMRRRDDATIKKNRVSFCYGRSFLLLLCCPRHFVYYFLHSHCAIAAAAQISFDVAVVVFVVFLLILQFSLTHTQWHSLALEVIILARLLLLATRRRRRTQQ